MRCTNTSRGRDYHFLVYVVTKLVRPDLKHRSKLKPPNFRPPFRTASEFNQRHQREEQEDYII